jgi:hypothetical protein
MRKVVRMIKTTHTALGVALAASFLLAALKACGIDVPERPNGPQAN